jgi:hypothetical protein
MIASKEHCRSPAASKNFKSNSFEDIPGDAIPAMTASMTAPKEHCGSTDTNKTAKSMDTADVFGILDFSTRVLMPWAGIACVRDAVRDSKDAEFLFALLSRRAMFDGTDGEAAWKDVMDLVCQRLAVFVEEAAASPEFGHLGMEVLERVVGYISGGEWSEETVYVCPCDNLKSCLSQANSQGFRMFATQQTSGGDIGVFVQADSTPRPQALAMSSSLFFVVGFQVKARAHKGPHIEFSNSRGPFDATEKESDWGWHNFMPAGDEERFRHNNSYKLSFRTRTSKWQRKCLALVRYYRKTSGNLWPIPDSHEQQWALLDAWRYYYSKAGKKKPALVFRKYVCTTQPST